MKDVINKLRVFPLSQLYSHATKRNQPVQHLQHPASRWMLWKHSAVTRVHKSLQRTYMCNNFFLISADEIGTSSGELICHRGTDDTGPLCGCSGSFKRVERAKAEARTSRLCRNCETKYHGQQHTRPCPHCKTAVGASAWPQHVRNCRKGDTDD